jgi:hypothetical protein
MPETTTLKVPSSELAGRIAAVTEEGSRLRTPFLAFASAARQALADFDAEVDVAGLTEDELQDAADALVRLHSDIEAIDVTP